MASSFLTPFAKLMSVHAGQVCKCYWKTTNKQESGMQGHWKFIQPLYKHESKKKQEREGTSHFSSHFIFTLQKRDWWQSGGWRNWSGMCVCKSNDSKTSLAKHRKVDKVVKRTFQGKILFCLSGFLLCNGIVRAAIETTFYFWRQGRKEVASTEIRKHLSTPSTISIAHSHWKNSSYKMCYRLMKSILH